MENIPALEAEEDVRNALVIGSMFSESREYMEHLTDTAFWDDDSTAEEVSNMLKTSAAMKKDASNARK